MMKVITYCFALLLWSGTLVSAQELTTVYTGAQELFSKHLVVIEGRRVGVIYNRTSLLPDGRSLVDRLIDANINVTALFSPEHGVGGNTPAGGEVENGTDPRLGLPIYSLYGKTKKPTKEMLEGVDAIVYDIQDVGARFYTYISTMALAMQAAAEQKKRFVVLDRPNPLGGVTVEGPVLDTSLSSFVGMLPMPIRHGLTIGEIARLIRYRWWKIDSLDLVIIPMSGWRRNMWFDEITVHWIAPSPNMRTLETAIVYPGACLFEGTNVSEGRGTEKPFQYIGAPWIQEHVLADTLNNLFLPGITFEPIRFTPKADSVAAPNPKYNNVSCGGIYLKVTDRTKFKPVAAAVSLLQALKRFFPDSLQFQIISLIN